MCARVSLFVASFSVCSDPAAMAPHSSALAWKIPRTEEPGRLRSMGLLESDMTERLHFHFSLSCIGEGNGNPLLCSCLENPRDQGAWWVAVYGVAQSRTRLKRLSSSRSIYIEREKDNSTTDKSQGSNQNPLVQIPVSPFINCDFGT